MLFRQEMDTSSMCGVGTILVFWKEEENTDCPKCKDDKNAAHDWLFQFPEASLPWKSSVMVLSLLNAIYLPLNGPIVCSSFSERLVYLSPILFNFLYLNPICH